MSTAEDRWWDHSPALRRARDDYAGARRFLATASERLSALEDEGIAQGNMWEHARRQFQHAAKGLTRTHKELWATEQRLGVPEEYRESTRELT